MFTQPDDIQFSLPAWLSGFVQGNIFIPDIDERMGLVIKAARRNYQEQSGGPFAAAVFECESGKLVSLGVNLVTSQGMSILHAEIVAIAIAQKKLGTYDLGADGMPSHEIVTSTEPCAMCFGAIPWSGVSRVITGARDEDARRIGFDEGPKVSDWRGALSERQIQVVHDVKRSEASQVLDEYQKKGGIIYNSRGCS